ncbi:hypothetical protein [Streptomyces megasporus]|uniref:hypothetical protein n=1 Tax=Streptomyces megasporus TaxID=44060 RepID=UPI00068D20EE|nr:hypothetical protein [Streptomyces megasporus]
MTLTPSPHRTGLVPRQAGPLSHRADHAPNAAPALGWLHPTGRVPAVLSAWERGVLAEVPTGIAWDVVRVPNALAHDTVQRLRDSGAPVGPVLSAPLGAEFFVARGSADGWDVAGGLVLTRGTLVLLPPPNTAGSPRVGERGWIVGPTDRLPRGEELRDAYAEARAHAAERAETAEAVETAE